MEHATFKTATHRSTPHVKVTVSIPMTIPVYYDNKKEVQDDDSEKRNINWMPFQENGFYHNTKTQLIMYSSKKIGYDSKVIKNVCTYAPVI